MRSVTASFDSKTFVLSALSSWVQVIDGSLPSQSTACPCAERRRARIFGYRL